MNTFTAIHYPKRVSSYASLAGPATQSPGGVFLAPKAILAAFQSELSAERGDRVGVIQRHAVATSRAVSTVVQCVGEVVDATQSESGAAVFD